MAWQHQAREHLGLAPMGGASPLPMFCCVTKWLENEGLASNTSVAWALAFLGISHVLQLAFLSKSVATLIAVSCGVSRWERDVFIGALERLLANEQVSRYCDLRARLLKDQDRLVEKGDVGRLLFARGMGVSLLSGPS